MTDDLELLRRYARDRSEEAFAELVRRRIDFVYACALPRLGGDTHLARDVSQQVFVALARNAPALLGHAVLAGWLFTTTRFIAAKAVRTERRRRSREQGAQQMSELSDPGTAAIDWDGLRPTISQAMDDLSEGDRMAVLLRFFSGCSFAEIGVKLNLSEDGARSRVERTLTKMERSLSRRGIKSTATALVAALTSQAAMAAPTGLAGTITAAALSAPATGGGAGLVAELLKFMTTNKTAMGLAFIVAAISFAGNAYQFKQAKLGTASLDLATHERDDLQARLTAENTKTAQLEAALVVARNRNADQSGQKLSAASVSAPAVSGSVSIQGAVRNPGRYELPPGSALSLVELLVKAGGFTDIAKGSDVRISHVTGGKTEHIDVQGIINGHSSLAPDDESLLLKPGDVVYVPVKLI